VFDHIALRTADIERLKAFYISALQPLGISVATEFPGGAGFARDGQTAFWLGQSDTAPSSLHLAFAAASRAEVDAFYRAALQAGAKDNGAPGLRTEYHAAYYGAFVLDPDGNNVEAVCHRA
jgi:catechol 2,3-dioxygenase-like lactoylglutathione lyase family enzyme